jgi:hypothetical protein
MSTANGEYAFLGQREAIRAACIEAGSKDAERDADEVMWQGKEAIMRGGK